MDVTLVVFNLVAFLVSGIFHEQAHARVSTWLGDETARNDGRLTWDPRVHIDPFMSVLIPLITLFNSRGRFLMGMMKPVVSNPMNFEHPTRGMALSAVAGPVSNMVLAAAGFAALGLFMALAPSFVYSADLRSLTLNGLFLCAWIQMNFILAAFNLLPLPGLDGSHVVYHFLPAGGRRVMDAIRPYGLLITIVIVFNVPGLLDSVLQLFFGLLRAAWGPEFMHTAFVRLWRS